MIHEEQVRQLCAIHTVNNLLQLPADLDYDSCGISNSICKEDTDDEVDQSDGCKQPNQVAHMWTCRGRIIRRYQQSSEGGINPSSVDMTPQESVGIDTKNSKQNIIWRVATKEEFDNIAKELTLREQMLMSVEEDFTFPSVISSNKETSTSRQSQATKLNNLSLMQQIRSPYGSPYFGNYSLDVIQEALKRRGVELEFYPVSDGNDITTIYDSQEDTRDNNNTSTCNKCLIGFVIYEKEENQRSALSVLSRIGSRIPVIKNFCGIGQHWYTITGVQYQQLGTSEKNATYNDKEDTSDLSWYVIDSKIRDISTLDSDNELVEVLKARQKEGALVFRAFAKSSG